MEIKEKQHGTRGYLFGLPIDSFEKDELLACIDFHVQNRIKRNFFAINPYSINIAFEDDDFRKIIHNISNDYTFIDGIGVTWGGKILGESFKNPIPTSDLILLICDYLNKEKKKYRVFFLGGDNRSAEKAAKYLTQICPYLDVVGIYEPPFLPYSELESKETPEILQRVNANPCDILFVGFGVPKQEKWVTNNRDRIDVPVVIPCGAMYGYYSGDFMRAPKLIRNMRMEWLFRLVLEPRKKFKRYVNGNIRYLYKVFSEKLSMRTG